MSLPKVQIHAEALRAFGEEEIAPDKGAGNEPCAAIATAQRACAEQGI